jgi:hypothetical protein
MAYGSNPTIQALPPKRIKANPPGLYRGPEPEVRKDVLMPGEMNGNKFFRPTFTLRWGRRGRGKTLTLVAEGYHFQQAYAQRNLRKGWHPGRYNSDGVWEPAYKDNGTYPWLIAANFQNTYADITRPFLVEELTEYPDWGWNMRIEIDEIAMYCHRRKWQMTSNLNLEGFITQIRKRSIEPSGATQFPQRLDGDIVEQIDLFIDCDIEPRGCGNPEHTFCAAQRVHDWWGQWSGNTKRKPWPPNVWEYDYFKWFHNCGMFFGAYVTEEIHSPIWLKDGDKNRIRLKQWGEEGDLEADEQLYYQQQNDMTREELKDWEPYAPDLSIGAPGEDQLAAFLRDKAHRMPSKTLTLSMYVREAETIDPNITTAKLLQHFCEKQGWEIKREGRTNTVYIP